MQNAKLQEIDKYLERSKKHTPACAKYALKVKRAKTMRELFEIALEVQGMEFLCESIEEGWGLSSDYICDTFKSYINGKYTFSNGEWTSCLYCRFEGEIKALPTLLCIIDSKVEINIPENTLCSLYVAGNSIVKVLGKGRVTVQKVDKHSMMLFLGENKVDFCNFAI